MSIKSNTKKAVCSWSGGKDSCYALNLAIRKNIKPVVLITMIDKDSEASKSNAVPSDILLAQAEALNLPIVMVPTSWDEYEDKLIETLKEIKSKYSVDYSVFGDIDIIEHKEFEEYVSTVADLKPFLPLWGKNRQDIAYQIIKDGISAKISVIRNDLIDEKYLGIDYDSNIFDYFRENNIDICGENGEFHTLLYKSPNFNKEILIKSETIKRINNYSFNIFKIRN